MAFSAKDAARVTKTLKTTLDGSDHVPHHNVDNLAQVEDAAHSTGATGVMALAVRKDTAAALAGTDGDYIPLTTDSTGKLWVAASLVSGSGATDLGKAEDAAHTTGDVGTMALAVRKDTAAALAGTDGDYAPLEVDANGRLHVIQPSTTVGGAASIPAGTNNIGDVDILTVPADPFGANADAAATAGSTGSIQAKLRLMTSQLDAIKTAVETIDNSISGSEIQADVVTQPARAATTDTITAKLATDTIQNGTTALTPKFAIIQEASANDNEVVAAVTGPDKKIRVLSYVMSASGAVNAKWRSATTDKSGLIYMAANGGVSAAYAPTGLFETAAGEALNLHLSGATAVGGHLTYVEV